MSYDDEVLQLIREYREKIGLLQWEYVERLRGLRDRQDRVADDRTDFDVPLPWELYPDRLVARELRYLLRSRSLEVEHLQQWLDERLSRQESEYAGHINELTNHVQALPDRVSESQVLARGTAQLFWSVQDIQTTVHRIREGVLNPPLAGKLRLGPFLRVGAAKLWELRIVWIVLLIVVFSAAGLLTATDGAPGTRASYGNNLYTAWMSFTTVGFGDWHPTGAIARIVSIVLAVLGAGSIGLLITVIWTAAVSAQEPKTGMTDYTPATGSPDGV